MSKRHKERRHIELPVAYLEFYEGDNTMWIHAPDGSTMLRIKTTGGDGIVIDDACTSPVAHADILVISPIRFCLPSNNGKGDPT